MPLENDTRAKQKAQAVSSGTACTCISWKKSVRRDIPLIGAGKIIQLYCIIEGRIVVTIQTLLRQIVPVLRTFL